MGRRADRQLLFDWIDSLANVRALLGYLIGATLIAGLGREVVDGVAAGRGAALAGARNGVAALAAVWRGSAAVGVRDTTRCGADAT